MFSHLMTRTVVFLKNEDGPTAMEYAVMLSLIAVVCVSAVTALGSNSTNTFNSVNSNNKKASKSHHVAHHH
jgi:pilus assembly protein Flp/PilA